MKLKRSSFHPALLAIYFFSSISAFGQQYDSSQINTPVNNAIDVYHQKMQRSSGLYNGAEYEEYPFNFQEGNPYFGSRDRVTGSIEYDGVVYQNVAMKYDELKDVVVIWYNNDAVQLLSEKVSRFVIGNHSFARITKLNQKDLLNPGFYEQLYPGKTMVLKKTIKSIQQKTDVIEGILRFIDQKTYYYLKSSTGYTQIDGKKDVIEVLKDHKNEIRDFINSKKLNFKEDPGGSLASVAAYYDTL